MLWERKVDYLFHFSWFVEDIALELGFIIAGILAINQIAEGSQKVGSFAFLMYVLTIVFLHALTLIG